VWRWDQAEPFGNNPADENPSGLGVFDLPLRLPGQYFDKETNLHYNYFRDYDPSLGRYGESDPIGLRAGLNTYGYVHAEPLRYIDPIGLAVWVCSRRAWNANAGVNHSYIWDGKNNRCCGMNRPHDPISTCKEKGPQPGGDSCTMVEGSDGKEDEIMNCCKTKASKGWWPKYDCHDLTEECTKDSNLNYPGAPGGRWGECGSCWKKPKPPSRD
jgi:RHS repeat-associated protein